MQREVPSLKDEIREILQRDQGVRGDAREEGEEIERSVDWIHDHIFQDGERRGPDDHPVLSNLSAAFIYQALPVPEDPGPPEFVYVPSVVRPGEDNAAAEYSVGITEWNIAWEAARLRPEVFSDRLPEGLQTIAGLDDVNVYLLPRGKHHRYDAFAPLYHLLPVSLLERNGLPVLRGGFWPHYQEDYWRDRALPTDFDERLERAFAQLVWRQIDSGSGYSAFSDDESIRLLAHNLDFWLPYAYRVIERRLEQFPRTELESVEQQEKINEVNVHTPQSVSVERPRRGGHIWLGETEAKEARGELFDEADASGRLRGILDAVRSARVEEDFSDRWSFAREDFERKLYRKRDRVRIKFVELDDTVPVHGPDSEVHEDLLWEDVIGLFNGREREVVVLLRSGVTKLGDIATQLGYANHSPVSKALKRIRRRVEDYLG